MTGGIATAAPGDLHVRLTAAGARLARTFALRESDLPVGFTPLRAQSEPSFRCPGFPIKLDDLTVSGREVRAYSRSTEPASVDLVASVADVFVNAGQAAALFSRTMQPSLLGCVQRALGVAVGSSSETLISHAFGAVPGLRGADQLALVVATKSGSGALANVSITLAAVSRGPAFAFVICAATSSGSFPSAGTVLARMASRMPAGG